MAGKNKSNEIKITRVYDAPVKMIWDAWTDPKKVEKWWGPRGFTLTTHSKDLKKGGHWTYTMHGPDGTDYPNKTIYHEVEKYRRLVYDHGGNEDLNRAPMFRVTAAFTESKGKTKLEMTMTLPTPEAAEQTKKFIKQAGGNGTWDRLAEFLEKESSGKEKFVIHRSFDAPRELVFKMWTDIKHLSKWLPPTGMTMSHKRADIKAGGEMVFSMTNGNMTLYGRVKYVEISPIDRLVYTQQFIDDKENISRHPGAPLWPETMLTTVLFEDEDDGQTRVAVSWEPYGKVSKEELAAFLAERAGMTMGWTGSFDKLEELLK